MDEAIKKTISYLQKAQSILFLTGAGISVDSGIKTYRGVGGVWTENEKFEDVPIEDIMTGETIRKNPELFWRCLSHREKGYRGATFNRGHQIVAEMEKHFSRTWVLTQNVDGFHSLAGSKNVLEIHGSMRKLLCAECSWQKQVLDYSELSMPPLCPQCQSILRPNVILFGEMLPGKTFQSYAREVDQGFDLVFSIGTMCSFPYLVGPILKLLEAGTPVVEINPEETPVSSRVSTKISLGATEALDKIWRGYRERQEG